MKASSLRFQLQQLDQALLALMQERARMCRSSALAPDPDPVAIEDLLRRADGSVPADVLREVFTLLHQGKSS